MTVVVLTSGTSYTIPGDWTSTNQIETWGGGASGAADGAEGSGGGGSGGYSTKSNTAGLSGALTIQVGVGGTSVAGGGGHDGNPGTGTWFNGTSVASSTVSSNPGSGGSAAAGGAGATTTSVNGTATAGAAGGLGSSGTLGGAGGGGGAPGPSGVGAVGGAGGTPSIGGTGGTGNNGSGGAGGAGGTAAVAGSPGTANTNGAGGGGGGGSVTGDSGGAGGLPGAGGGGTGAGGGNSGAGGGGQIRITYTPVATQITNAFTELPPLTKYRQLRNARDGDKFEFQGWQRSPISSDSVQANGVQPTFVPPGNINLSRYQDWQRPPLAPSYTIQTPPTAWTDLPVRSWTSARQSYQGTQEGPIPAEYLVPLPSTDVPKGRYNPSRYQDIQVGPSPANVVAPPVQPFYDMPVRSWDYRRTDLYQGSQLTPQPQIMSPPSPVFDVPRGQWNSSRNQDWQQSYQRLEFQAPLPQVDVPQGVKRFDYMGWQNFPVPADVGPPLQASVCTDLPMPSALSLLSRHMNLFQGQAVAPTPGNVVPVIPAMWLPLLGVGNQGP